MTVTSIKNYSQVTTRTQHNNANVGFTCVHSWITNNMFKEYLFSPQYNNDITKIEKSPYFSKLYNIS